MLNETIFSLGNQTKPFEIVVTSSTNWTQYSISLVIALIGSVFVLIYLWNIFGDEIKTWILKIHLRRIQKKTHKPLLIIKHTQSGFFGGSMIDQETLQKVMKALQKFNGRDFDLILHSPGGDVFMSLYISRLLQSYPGKITAIIPGYAMSGGTLLALSCDEIKMLPYSCLGCVDPQLGSLFKYGSAKSWDKILKFKGKKAEDQSISFAYTGKQYTKSIYNHIYMLLEGKIPENKRKSFTKFLTSGEVEHAFPLTPDKLREVGMIIGEIEPEYSKKIIKLISNKGLEGVAYIDIK